MSKQMEWEKSQMNISGEFSEAEISAFGNAMQADLQYQLRITDNANRLVAKALEEYPLCVDALRLQCKMLMQTGNQLPTFDSDSILCIFREYLAFFIPHFHALIEKYPGGATEAFQLRPVVRFLNLFTTPTMMADKIEVCIHALEEVLRLDYEDHTFARENLLLAYLKIIGRSHRRQVTFIRRNETHVRALMDCHFPGSPYPLFDTYKSTRNNHNHDMMVLKWAKLMLSYKNGTDEWKQLAKELEDECSWLMKFVFDEVPKQLKIPRNDQDFVQMDANRIAERLVLCLFDWPQLLIDMYVHLRGRRNIVFEEIVLKRTPNVFSDLCREAKPQRASLGMQFLEQGRSELRYGHAKESITFFTLARRSFAELMSPSTRWYPTAPWQIVSNRALAAERTEQWAMCRSDTRMTIAMTIDHIRSYDRIPKILEKYGATELAAQATAWLAEWHTGRISLPDVVWREKSRRALAYLSISAIMLSKMHMLTEEKMEELMGIGIDDMYIPVNIGIDVLDNLPWLQESDLQQL